MSKMYPVGIAAWLLSGWVACVQAAALDLAPITPRDWNAQTVRHLYSRAGFGVSLAEARRLAEMSPARVVRALTRPPRTAIRAEPFVASDIFDAGLDPFPPSRPAATELAKRQGHALGVSVKPGGDRPLQPVVNKFFYWLRASRLETDRVAYWWAERMLRSDAPLAEKMALFWHGHFATNEDKVRDYRKMFKQLQLFRTDGLGSFGELLLAVAQDPAMLVFLDAGVNTKDSPNENFAREILELFTMGVGHYSEQDVQEAARAFTGWNVANLEFVVNAHDQDRGVKTFLGHSGPLGGEDVVAIILAHPQTARFVASKIYRYFVSNALDAAGEVQLGELLMDLQYDVARFLEVVFSSRDFYRPEHVGSRIKGPVELLISTYRLLEQPSVPGVPDFNVVAGALGQRLMHPPTVAGWSHGRSWITPSLLFERGNFVLDVLFPDIGFIAPDRYPAYTGEVVNVQNRLRQGQSIAAATRPTGMGDGEMAASNLLADRDEAFNTRLGSMRGWQMAIERVQPIPRHTARINLVEYARARELTSVEQAVRHFAELFISVPLAPVVLQEIAAELAQRLGTRQLDSALEYAEEDLRIMLHRLLSLPEYQLG